MIFSFTKEIKKELKSIKENRPNLYRKIIKQLNYFAINPHYPSLRRHKLSSNLVNSWSISIERNYRMIYFLDDDKAVFFLMGTHQEVYKK